jgi:hypothetical protein
VLSTLTIIPATAAKRGPRERPPLSGSCGRGGQFWAGNLGSSSSSSGMWATVAHGLESGRCLGEAGQEGERDDGDGQEGWNTNGGHHKELM